MNSLARVALLGIAENRLAQELLDQLSGMARVCQFLVASNIAQMRAKLAHLSPAVILLDESVLDGSSFEVLVRQFAESAPVVVVASPARLREIAFLVASGDVDSVARIDDYVPLAAGLIERRIRWTGRAESSLGTSWSDLPADFPEILRHEINNPLTGILGNAELLLAHRERLSSLAVQRVETIVDLAVRLRETIRRVSLAWENDHHQARSA
jgi:signal transduction histidine kinase